MSLSFAPPAALPTAWTEALDRILDAFAAAIAATAEREQAASVLPAAPSAENVETKLAAVEERLGGLDALSQRCERAVGEAAESLRIAAEEQSAWLSAVAANRQKLARLGVSGI